MLKNSKLSPDILKEKEAQAQAKGIVSETNSVVEKRPIDYVWTVFIFLAFAIICCWYVLIYSAR